MCKKTVNRIKRPRTYHDTVLVSCFIDWPRLGSSPEGMASRRKRKAGGFDGRCGELLCVSDVLLSLYFSRACSGDQLVGVSNALDASRIVEPCMSFWAWNRMMACVTS